MPMRAKLNYSSLGTDQSKNMLKEKKKLVTRKKKDPKYPTLCYLTWFIDKGQTPGIRCLTARLD